MRKAVAKNRVKTKRSNGGIAREPKQAIKDLLRREVGFGCPVQVKGVPCGSPFLTWHHFDPEWHVQNHHNPAGMIALCREHHDKAGGRAYTVEQLRELKAKALERAREVQGSFDWMRREIVVVSGGAIHLTQRTVFEIDDRKVVWFNRDENSNMLLNIRMLTTSGKPRFVMEDNYWVARGEPIEVVCPPVSPRIQVTYENGDQLQVEFRGLDTADEARRQHPYTNADVWDEMTFPLTSVEVQMKAPGTGIELGEREMRIRGNVFVGCTFSSAGPNGTTIRID